MLVDSAGTARQVDRELRATDEADFAELSGDDRRMRGASAHRGENARRIGHPQNVGGRGFTAHQDGRIAAVGNSLGGIGIERYLVRLPRRFRPRSRVPTSIGLGSRQVTARDGLEIDAVKALQRLLGWIRPSVTRSIAILSAAHGVRLARRVCNKKSRPS